MPTIKATYLQIPKNSRLMGDRNPASFRDPSGHVFLEDGIVFRQINRCYFRQFSQLVNSGLYSILADTNMLVSHEVVVDAHDRKVIRPAQLDLVTFPYEWSFSQLKDAAILTLKIHLVALEHGMVLKDATAFNVQFQQGKPIFIDTLSFDSYKNDDPWMAYGQFCRHFLGPLLLMKYRAPDFNRFQVLYTDGVPLELASTLLPIRTHLSPFIKANIHLHADSLRKHKSNDQAGSKPQLSLRAHRNIVNSIIDYIARLSLEAQTEWTNYYEISNYKDEAFHFKEEVVRTWVKKYDLKRIWDIGGNNGHFSRLIQDSCELIVCTDTDPGAVDENYRTAKNNNERNIVPLMVDYTNPTPGIGFDNAERPDFLSRIRALKIDCILALALIHHLSISSNCSFAMLAGSFSQSARNLLVEFVDPDDSWADSLLRSKRDARPLFSFYNRSNFEDVFSQYFRIAESARIPSTRRTLYLMSRKQ